MSDQDESALLAAVRRGLSRAIEPGAPWTGNVGGEVDPEMPPDWNRAPARMQASAFVRETLGGHYVEVYCCLERAEMRALPAEIPAIGHAFYL